MSLETNPPYIINPHQAKPTSIALLSSGLDSVMALALAQKSSEVVLALTIDYGQRAAAQEIQHSQQVADYYHVPHHVVSLPWFQTLLPKTLDQTVPESELAWGSSEAPSFYEAKPVWVPNRNGVLLNIAAAFAETHGAQQVIFGGNAEEATRFPDNTEAFRQATNHALSFSTLTHVTVVCPVQSLTKAQMITLAIKEQVPLGLIWSCYESGQTTENTHCGQCPSCVRLRAALKSSPTPQADRWLAQLFKSNATVSSP